MGLLRCFVVAICAIAGLAPFRAPAKASESSCWNIAYAAIRHRAAASHPRFILYDATGTIVQDGEILTRATAAIVYRDDGTALVTDDRFVHPYVTTSLHPGPPELGPYAGRRAGWLLPDIMDPVLRVIAKVNTQPDVVCTNEGIVQLHGREDYDLVFGSPGSTRTGLRELYVDEKSLDIWKVVLRGGADSPDSFGPPAPVPVDYQIELEQSGPYLVVRHVTWQYTFKDYSQQSTVFGEYYYDDFRFPSHLPAADFQD